MAVVALRRLGYAVMPAGSLHLVRGCGREWHLNDHQLLKMAGLR